MITQGSDRIAEGKWVLFTPYLPHGICSAPRRIERLTIATAFYRNPRTNGIESALLRAVVFVCDTKAEADNLFKVSEYQRTEIERAIFNARAGCAIAIEQLMEQSK